LCSSALFASELPEPNIITNIQQTDKRVSDQIGVCTIASVQ
jgi:hypothetical protein